MYSNNVSPLVLNGMNIVLRKRRCLWSPCNIYSKKMIWDSDIRSVQNKKKKEKKEKKKKR